MSGSSIAHWTARSQNLLEALGRFFQDHLPLYVGFIAFLSASLFSHFSLLSLSWLILSSLTALSYSQEKLLHLLLTLSVCMLFFLRGMYSTPASPPEELKTYGVGIFSPEKVVTRANFFHTTPYINGVFYHFHTQEREVFHRLPCSIPLKGCDPSQDLWVVGEFKQNKASMGFLRPLKIEPIKGTFNFSALRWKWQQTFSSYLQKVVHKESVGNFLIALLCGQIEEKILSLEFSKIGLSHILAISGFHFSVIATAFGGILFSLFSKKRASFLLAFLLFGYAFFVGFSPSVLRALIMTLFSIWASLLYRKKVSLNTFGIALFFTTLCFPELALSIGFVLTFLCTFAILFFYPMMDEYLQKVFLRRSKEFWFTLPFGEKLLIFLSTLLRKALALNLAVFLWTTPCVLYFFKSFPLISLVYNLFVPFAVAIAIFICIAAICLHPIVPPAAIWIHRLNSHFIDTLLKIVAEPPPLLHYQLEFSLPLSLVVLWLSFFFFLRLSQIAKKQELVAHS